MSSNDNNKNTGNSHAIMSLIDENKEDIPEGLYLNLCNLLKKQNEEEEKEDKEDKFYKVTYLYSSPSQQTSNTWEMNLCSSNEILKLSEFQHRTIKQNMITNGYVYSFTENLSQYANMHNYVRTIDNGGCGECDRCEECSSSEANTHLISRCCIVSIEPA